MRARTHSWLILGCTCLAMSVGSAQPSARQKSLYESIYWIPAPNVGPIGTVASVRVPEGCKYTGRPGAAAFLELTQNPPDPTVAGVMVCTPADTSAQTWFVLYSYEASGYVKDDEKNSLDADKLLASMREGTAHGNRLRVEKGWDTLSIERWITPPFYDTATNNLTWALLVRESSGDASANHSVRLLGRGGVISAELVADAAQLDQVIPQLNGLIAETNFSPGQKYSEWKPGDKIAEYGLAALVAGGAGAAVVKYGVLGKLWKLVAAFFVAAWKMIAAAVIGLSAWIKSLFRKKEKATDS